METVIEREKKLKSELKKKENDLKSELENSKDGQKQLQFAQSERNKVQSAYDALKKQWEEHFTTCGKGSKENLKKTEKLVAEREKLQKALESAKEDHSQISEQNQNLQAELKKMSQERDELRSKVKSF